MNAIVPWIVSGGDWALGWLLLLPRDLAVVLLAVITGALIAVVRCFTVDPKQSRLAKQDAKKLKRLIRRAAKKKDDVALSRHRRNRGVLGRLRMWNELKVLLVTIVPLYCIIVWALHRFDYLPPQPNSSITLDVRLPAAEAGSFVHLLPQDDVLVERVVVPVVMDWRDDQHTGVATWNVSIQNQEPFELMIRTPHATLTHPLQLGSVARSPQSVQHDEQRSSHLSLPRYHPFGVDVDWRWLGIPNWLVLYALSSIVVHLIIRLLQPV